MPQSRTPSRCDGRRPRRRFRRSTVAPCTVNPSANLVDLGAEALQALGEAADAVALLDAQLAGAAHLHRLAVRQSRANAASAGISSMTPGTSCGVDGERPQRRMADVDAADRFPAPNRPAPARRPSRPPVARSRETRCAWGSSPRHRSTTLPPGVAAASTIQNVALDDVARDRQICGLQTLAALDRYRVARSQSTVDTKELQRALGVIACRGLLDDAL